MDERLYRTERAAFRLIKSRVRQHLYKAKAKETHEHAYESMLMVEDAISEEATREWKSVLASCAEGLDKTALTSILEKVLLAVYRESRPMADELGPVTRRALKRFFANVDLKEMLV